MDGTTVKVSYRVALLYISMRINGVLLYTLALLMDM